MRLNTKKQGWAYSIGRLWSQVRAGSLFKVANSYFFQAQRLFELFTPSEGSLLAPAEGSFFLLHLMARLVTRLMGFQ